MDVGSPQWIAALTDVIKTIGRDQFVDRFMALLNGILPVDHCAVFTFSPEGQARHLFTKSKMPPEKAAALAEDYVGGLFRDDPNLPLLENAPAEGPSPIIPLQGDRFDQHYRKHFFEETNLIDKASMVTADDSGIVYCNFYRMRDSGRYSKTDWQKLSLLLPLMTSLIAAHHRALHSATDTNTQDKPAHSLVHSVIGRAAPPFDKLTAREREVCARVLLGYTTEAIALDLNIAPTSVATYRKRAYAKLGIATQNELFTLCLSAIRAPA
jgi:DNA-binding CsgD family transcriptional regulator